mmetsp:Transcript_35063/g.79970  ORF Transcript_35063/g.79970 Transcript_35063/m.79970 type:complete len:268 (-) Transcript_35063:721-1524(-)
MVEGFHLHDATTAEDDHGTVGRGRQPRVQVSEPLVENERDVDLCVANLCDRAHRVVDKLDEEVPELLRRNVVAVGERLSGSLKFSRDFHRGELLLTRGPPVLVRLLDNRWHAEHEANPLCDGQDGWRGLRLCAQLRNFRLGQHRDGAVRLLHGGDRLLGNGRRRNYWNDLEQDGDGFHHKPQTRRRLVAEHADLLQVRQGQGSEIWLARLSQQRWSCLGVHCAPELLPLYPQGLGRSSDKLFLVLGQAAQDPAVSSVHTNGETASKR